MGGVSGGDGDDDYGDGGDGDDDVAEPDAHLQLSREAGVGGADGDDGEGCHGGGGGDDDVDLSWLTRGQL